jgi:hypothetical protein
MTIDRPLLPIEEVQNQMQNPQIASEISGNSSTVRPSHLYGRQVMVTAAVI